MDIFEIIRTVLHYTPFEFDEIAEDSTYLIFSYKEGVDKSGKLDGVKQAERAKFIIEACYTEVEVTFTMEPQDLDDWVVLKITEKKPKVSSQLSLF